MAAQDTLASVLSEFARTMLTDFRIQGILDQLVERIVDVLAVSGAGVTLISPGKAPQFVAASDAAALRFERLQTDLAQGPCLTAWQSGELVTVPDLARDVRYPAFGPAAVAGGLAAVFTFPLRHGDRSLGALDLYRDVPGELDAQDLVAAQTLADVASAYLLNAQARELALEARDRYRHVALHDALTGLPNRVLLQQRLAHAEQRAQRSHAHIGVLFADLDRFKAVNDTYGHGVGNELLVAVAQRLLATVRTGDTLARVSGDEFVILCEDLAHPSEAEALAVRINAALATPFELKTQTVRVTASIGIAYAGPGEAVTEQLLIDADTAMYQAKRRGGRAHQVLDRPAARQVQDRDLLQHDLGAAIGGPALGLAYQPIVRTSDGYVLGVEALLRWTHPNRGPIPALTAIAIAEQHGLIHEVGAWVLQRACEDRIAWAARHPGQPLDLSVNVSARQLMAPGFSATVAAVLDRTGLDPAALVLEVTEGILIDDGGRAVDSLIQLKALGTRIALDDFGTGYCSLSYLRRLPVDIIKIDQSFVAAGVHDPSALAITSAVTRLAHTLGMTVTAEGVETHRQHQDLSDLGCDHAQGFLYAPPLSSPALTARLDQDSPHPLHLG